MQLNPLPMGMVASMDGFNQWLAPVLNCIRSLLPEVFTHAYCDDIIFVLPPSIPHHANVLARQIHFILQTLGIPIKQHKSSTKPSRQAHYLGFQIRTNDLSITIPAAKRRDVMKQLKKTLRRDNAGTLQLRHLATTIGKLIALLPVVSEAKLHARALYELQGLTVMATGWRGIQRVRLDLCHKSELQWWLKFLNSPVRRHTSTHYRAYEWKFIAADASDHTIASVLFSHPHLPHFRRPLSYRERSLQINAKELIAVRDSLLFYKVHHNLSHCLLNIRSDSSTVVHILNRWGSKSRILNSILLDIHNHCLANDILITATYIPTHSNVYADRLSRLKPIRTQDVHETKDTYHIAAKTHPTQWHFDTSATHFVKHILRKRPQHDLLQFHGPTAVTISSGRLSTPSTFFAFPHLNSISTAIDMVEQTRSTCLMILPLWPQAAWFNKAAHLAITRPIPIRGSFAQQLRKSATASWAWIGVLLSGQKATRTRFRNRWCSRKPHHLRLPRPIPARGMKFVSSSKKTRDYILRFVSIMAKSKH